MATNWYGANQNFRQGNYYDGAQEYNENLNPNNPNYGRSFAGVGRFDPRTMMLPSNLSQDLGAATYQAPTVYPGQRNIHEGFGTGDLTSTFEPPENRGILENLKNKLSGFTTPALDFLKKIGGQRSDAKQAEWDALRNVTDQYGTYRTGTLPGGQYADIVDGKITVTAPDGTILLRDKNFDSSEMFGGSASVADMIQKKEDWSKGQFDKYGETWTDDEHKGLSRALYDHYKRTGVLDKWRGASTTVRGDPIDISQTEIIDRPVNTGVTDRAKIEAYTGRPMSAYRASRPASERQFTGHGRSGMGRDPADRMAYGGRIGYQDGELVEDEYMAEATPRGMMEENIEEVQGEPTREQLEVIALEIFRLPLEELNDEQLNVVYQAAMEQEPAEEEVQFAAQEGPGEGIASLV